MRGVLLTFFLIALLLLVGDALANEEGETSSSPSSFRLFSNFHNDTEYPLFHTCNGPNSSPPLAWENAPSETDSFVVTLVDMDGLKGKKIHWLGWAIPGNASSLPANTFPPKVGITDFPQSGGYRGPCLETGEKHRFVFTVYAVGPGASFADLHVLAEFKDVKKVIKGHVLAKAKLYFIVTGHSFGSEDASKAIEEEQKLVEERVAAEQRAREREEAPVSSKSKKVKGQKIKVQKGNPKLKTTLDKDLLCYSCLALVKRGFQEGKKISKNRLPLNEIEVVETIEKLCREEELNSFAFPPQQMAPACRFFISEFEDSLEETLKLDASTDDAADQFCREMTAVCDGYTDDDVDEIIRQGPKEAFDSAGRKWAKKPSSQVEKEKEL